MNLISHNFSMLKNNKIWLLLSSISFALVAISSLQAKNTPIKLSVYLGILYLCLTLIPNNLALILPANLKKWPNWVAKYKRDFGISAGLMFLVHASLAWNFFGKLELDFIFRGEIILGFLANIIFVLLLLTSSQWSKRVMKKNWKRLHILVWAAVPLAFFHSNLATVYYDGEISNLAVIGFGSLYLLAFIQLFFKKWQHFAIVFVAWLLSLAIMVMAYPQTLQDFNDSLAASNTSQSSSDETVVDQEQSSSSSESSSSSSSSVAEQSSSSSSSSEVVAVSSSSAAPAPAPTPPAPKPAPGTVSKSQLSSSNTSSKCWISYAKKVA